MFSHRIVELSKEASTVTARVEEAKQSYERGIQRDANNVSAKKKFDGFVAECNRQGSESVLPQLEMEKAFVR